jgi:large subunit ribosomal protein L24
MNKSTNKKVNLGIKTGDTVKVIAGDDRNKTGLVTAVDREKQRVIIEGVNMKTKHTKPSAQNPQGGISQKEASVHVSNVMLVDNTTGKTFRTGKKLNGDNKLQRYNKKTGNLI